MCHEAGQSAFLHTQLYLSTNLDHIYLATFLGTNSLFVLMCRNAVNQSICTLNIRSLSNPLYYILLLPTWHIPVTLMSLFSLKLGFLLTVPLLNYLKPFLVVSPSLAHLVFILIHAFLQSLVAHNISSPWTLQTKLFSTPTTTSNSLHFLQSQITIKLPHLNPAKYTNRWPDGNTIASDTSGPGSTLGCS